MMARIAVLEAALAAASAKIAATEAKVARLEAQQVTSHGVGLAAQQTACALQQSMAAGEAANQQLQQQVAKLEARQQGAERQRELAECQQSVVLGLPSPLPDEQRPAEVQALLANLLEVQATVLGVQSMGKQSPSGDNGNAGQRGKHTYKVKLASCEQRAAVLRSKKEHMGNLRTADVSIRELLTSAQVATKKVLSGVYRAAKLAGSRVQWRLDRLFINGKEHNGSGTLPQPRQQPQQQPQQQAQPGGQQQQQAQPNRQQRAEGSTGYHPVEEKEEGEWQQPKPKKGHKGNAAANPKQAQ